MMLPTKILPRILLDTVKRTRPIYHFGRKARFAVGSGLGARNVPGLEGKAHYNDFMLDAADARSVESYRRGAREFIEILARALADSGRSWESIGACLEIGCGYGRIIRELRPKFPAMEVTVCDTIEEAAAFTAEEFNVRKAPVVEQMPASYDGTFHLIYLLSVYTHLPQGMIEANLARVALLAKPGGVIVFTTHGQRSADIAEIYEQYWLDKGELRRELELGGYYYERYPYYYSDYGMTWFKDANMRTLVARVAPGLKFIAWLPAGLERHQDVYIYQRVVDPL